MKTITLEQLSIYLPYGLKYVRTIKTYYGGRFDHSGGKRGKLAFTNKLKGELLALRPNINLVVTRCGSFKIKNPKSTKQEVWVTKHSDYKPLLHLLSKFKDINSESMNNLGIDLQDQIWINELANGWVSFSKIPFNVIQIMAKNHIDIYNLIGQGLAEEIK